MHPFKAALIASLAGVASLVPVPVAWANIAPRFWGDPTSEPWGLKDVAVVQERLTIDMRPLADRNPVRVEVTYDLSNAGPSRHLDLLFVSGEVGLSDFEAHLGDTPLRTRLLPASESRSLWEQSPRSWRPSKEAPGIVKDQTFYLFVGWDAQPEIAAFALDLPPGASTLRVRYLARACGAAERATVTWQFPYVLAPAREWGSFGRLDVVVHVPARWDARSTPALDRDGDTLRGSFDGLPADALLLATGAPVPPEYSWAIYGVEAFCAFVLLGGPVMCWWAGRLQGLSRIRFHASGKRGLWAGIRVVVLATFPALLWGSVLFALQPVSERIVKASLHGQESPWFGDHLFEPCCVILVIPVAVLSGVVITLASASRAAARRLGQP
jgi:hypothetical protein